jgi:hypothetical protein
MIIDKQVEAAIATLFRINSSSSLFMMYKEIEPFLKSNMRRALEAADEAAWMPIEDAPKDVEVLVKYSQELGTECIVKSKFIPKFTFCSMAEDCCEYDEKTDKYYLFEGWYEIIHNWDEYNMVSIASKPTHFRHMPKLPKSKD